MLLLDSVWDWRGGQSMKTAFGSRVSLFDAQTLPRHPSKGFHQGILNLATVVGRAASLSHQGMLTEIFEHLTHVREHEWRSSGARLTLGLCMY